MSFTATAHDAIAVTNLLGRYAECIDAGDFEGAADLFTHATLKFGVDANGAVIVDSVGFLKMFRDNVIVYADGTPRTKHVVTNPVVTVDEAVGIATCHSY